MRFRRLAPDRARALRPWPSRVAGRAATWTGAIVASALWASAAAFVVRPQPASAQLSEYALKAAYLFNLINLTEWPAAAFPAPDAPLRVCLIEPDPFGRLLDETLGGESVAGHPLVVARMPARAALTSCHVVFVPAAVPSPGVLAALAKRPVLTVGESEAFWSAGGMVRFVIENRKVRFDANTVSAQEAGLTLSARLMQVARQRRVAP